MAAYDEDFSGYLKTVWDTAFKRHDRLVMVICGSVSSWIARNILDSTGFVGRRALDMVVGELSPRDCMGFWGDAAERVA